MKDNVPAPGTTGGADTESDSAAAPGAVENLACAHCGKPIHKPIITYTCMCHAALAARAQFIARQVRRG